MNTRSRKGFTLVEIMIVVVIIGLLAAMAIPAFQKVRRSSQEKTIINDARQIAAGAAQYYLENGVSTVLATSLIGADGYVKQLGSGNSLLEAGLTQGLTFSLANTSYGTIVFDDTAQSKSITLK
jgi:type IV pilus assembly protein PilA